MKRRMAILVGLLLCGCLLAGCGGMAAGSSSAAGLTTEILSHVGESAGVVSLPEDGHVHPTVENNVTPHELVGYCGNTVTTVTCSIVGKAGGEKWSRSFWGSESVALTDLLIHLDYSGDICRCLPEYTVDTEFGNGYGVSLSQGYARYDGGQVSLMDAQLEEIRSILGWAKEGRSDQITKISG